MKCLMPSYPLQDLNLPGHICKKPHTVFTVNTVQILNTLLYLSAVFQYYLTKCDKHLWFFLTCATHNLKKN